MKLLKKILHELVPRIRESAQIIALMKSGQWDRALTRSHLISPTAVQEWEAIGKAAAKYGIEAESVLFYALRKAGINYPLFMACGEWLLRHGESLQAILFFRAAHQIAPAESAPLLAQGELHLAMSNFQVAAERFMAALQREETCSRADQGLQEVRRRTGLPDMMMPQSAESDAPRDLYDKIEKSPNDFRPYFDVGRWFISVHRSAAALPFLETAHRLSGATAETAYPLALALAVLQRHKEASAIAFPASDSNPEDMALLKLAAECAAVLGQDERAVELYQRLIARNPEVGTAVWSNLGNCLAHLERYAEALVPLEHAVAQSPKDIIAHLNLSYAALYAGRLDMASKHLETLLAIEPHNFNGRWQRASLLLTEHRFAEGWKDYEYRLIRPDFPLRVIPYPRWSGQSLANKKIVVTAEQGVGDEVMFASSLLELCRMAGEIVIECEPRLAKLFSRSFSNASIISKPVHTASNLVAALGEADYYIPIGSLPSVFRNTIESFEQATIPYLVPDPSSVKRLHEKMECLGQGLKVGIAWRGGIALTRKQTRSLTLQELAPILTLPGCHFISIQYGDCITEIDAAQQAIGTQVHHWPEILADLDQFAALTAALDLIVTVCSTPVHFAGALGKPALVLVPFVPEWRYVGHNGHMIWYPGVRLLKQPEHGSWQPVIDQAMSEIAHLAKLNHTAPNVTT